MTLGVTSQALVSALSATVDRTLDEILPSGRACALIDFPCHGNVGDHAIWLGQRAALQRTGHRVAYACGTDSYRPEDAAAGSAGATILLSGGGNLGDLWPAHQRLREAVIASFPDVPVVQLPQSIEFRDHGNLERARSVFDAHPDLVLLVRDNRSLDFARKNFRAESRLCPDMAFALGPLDRLAAPTRDVLWLAREDQEASAERPALTGLDFERTDWVGESPARALRPALESYDAIARHHLDRGRRLLSRGRAVLTDRLHGHILSVLMAIPHVVLDNNYGKLRGSWETWASTCSLARFVPPSSAADAVKSLLQAAPQA